MAVRTDVSNEQIVVDQRDESALLHEEKMLRHVMTDLESARQTREGHESDWDKYFRKWMCELDHGKLPWKSKIVDPEVFAALETVAPRIQNTLLGGPEIFGVKPTGQDDVMRARNSKHLLDYQADRMNLFERMSDIIKDGLVYGTGLGKARWRKEYEPRIKMYPVLDELGLPALDPVTGQPAMKPEKRFVLTYDDPWVDRVDIKSLFVDPEATDFQNARFVIHRTQRTRDYLRKKEAEGVYHNIELIPAADSSDSFIIKDDNRQEIIHRDMPKPKLHDDKLDLITVDEYYGSYDIDNCGYLEECIIVIANGKTVIRADYNPFPGGFKPFVKFTPIPIPGAFYGMSLITPIDSVTDALNDRTNQIGDNVNLALNNMWVVNRHADIDPDQLVSMPGGVIETNQPGIDIVPLPHNDIVGSVFPEVNRLESKIQRALGTYDYAAGGAPQRQEAATTVISLQQVAEIRFKTMVLLFERQIIRPLGNMLLKMTAQMMGPERQIRILGREMMMGFDNPSFLTIGPEDLAIDADIYAIGAGIDPSISKQVQLQNLMNFLSIVMANPMLMKSPMFGIDFSVIVEELPYLLDLKLKRPLVLPLNPLLAYEDMKQEETMVDGMMMSQFGAMNTAAATMGQEPPSRVKGELSKDYTGGEGGGEGQ